MFRCNVKRPSLHALLVVLLCLCTSLQTTARLTPLQGKEISISVKKSSLSNVLYEISKKSGITIYFVNEDLVMYKDITYEAKNQEVKNILNDLLKGKDLQYEVISEKQIGIRKVKEKTFNSVELRDTLLTISGKVTDENGNSIPGATVAVKGTQLGAVTNDAGNFVIKNVAANAILTISSVSFLTREVPVKNRPNIGVAELNKIVKPLDDVIVLAYTTTTGKRLIGNVSNVKAKAIENTPTGNAILAVAGRVPGVTINQSSGFAGSGVDITIQGLNSLQRGVAPFYVVDGVPYTQSLLPNFANVLGTSGRGAGDGPVTGNPLSYINPQDIASIEILKDADATAIYGSRAANGAIIITTKRGKAGTMRVGVNIQTGFAEVARHRKLLSTADYITIRREAKTNDGLDIGPTDYDINGTWDSTRYTDWQKELIGRNANFSDAQLTLSGGSEKMQYLLGGNYHKERSVLPTELGNTKASVRFNFDTRSDNDRFRISFSGSYLYDNNRLPVTDLTEFTVSLAPNAPPLKNPDGSINFAPNSQGVSTFVPNPLANLNPYYYSKTSNLLSNMVLRYQVFNGLDFKANLGYTKLHTDELKTSPASIFPSESWATFIRTANFGFNDISSWIMEPQFNYNNNNQIAAISIIVGASIQQSTNSRKVLEGSGFDNDQVLENLGAATNITASSTILTKYKYNAGFFSINLNRQEKYFLNFSGRRDGSSRFGPETRFHNFAAIGAGWVFSEEDFIKNKLRFLSFGKVKVSYGSTGNDQIGDYNYLSLYSNNNPDVPYRQGAALTIDRITNPLLQWEETKKLSLGAELGFVDDRFLLTVVHYQNRSSNMLVPGSIPATAGPVNSLTENIPAVILNKGFEFTLNTSNIRTNSFSWLSNINLTLPHNELASFGSIAASTYRGAFKIGEPINYIRTFRSKGVNAATGKYEFLDKDGKVIDRPDADQANYTVAINPSATIYGGMSNTFSFKGVTLDFLFQYVKQKGKNQEFYQSPGTVISNMPVLALSRWQKEGDITRIQKLTSNSAYRRAYTYQNQSDANWEDASFLRLKNVSVTYDLPKQLLSAVKIQSCQVYLLGQNLLTITRYKGLDPETKSNLVLPPLRVLTFGIRAGL